MTVRLTPSRKRSLGAGVRGFALSALLAGVCSAQGFDRANIMDPSELKAGMKGYGLTVFGGTEPEKFDLTILGVAKNYRAGTDMIMIRIDHPLINLHGVVAGMSGSPIYVDGKLIGAAAFGWGWSTHPVAGVQPIKGMFEILDQVTPDALPRRPLPPRVSGWPEAKAALSPELARPATTVTIPGDVLRKMGIDEAAREESVEFRPIATPVLIGSANPAMATLFTEYFGDTGMVPVLAGSSGGDEATADPEDLSKAKMVDGGAVAVSFCEGDLYLAAVGTTTFVEKDRLVAFGHPMIGFGNVDMPVSEASIAAIIPSLSQPFKLGRALHPAGALRQDRAEGIGITLKKRPELIPLSVRIISPETSTDRNFSYRLWADRFYMPGVAGLCLAGAIETVVRDSGPMTIDSELTIAMEDGKIITHRQFFSGDDFIGTLSQSAIASEVGLLTSNPVDDFPIKSMSITARVGDKVQYLVMADARLDRTSWKPGETVTGSVKFERWREDPVRVPVSLKLPADTPDGRYELVLTDFVGRRDMEFASRPELAKTKTREDVYRRVDVDFPGNRMWTVLWDPARQLVMDNFGMTQLPRSVIAATAETSRQTNMARIADGRILAETELAQPNRVAGQRRIAIEVDSRAPEAPTE